MIKEGNEQDSREYPLESYSTDGLGFTTGFDQAISDNLITKGHQAFKANTDYYSPRISREDALKRAEENGVKLTLEEDQTDIGEDTLNLLIDRQYKRNLNSHIIARSNSVLAPFAGQLIGSMTDPINVALNFVPVVGQARYAKWLANASGIGGRAAVRAGVGFAEGVVGATIAEPASYLLSQQLQDDYTMADSLMNIGVGGVMGSTFHVGLGAIGDGIKAYKARNISEGPMLGPDPLYGPEAPPVKDIEIDEVKMKDKEVKERIESEVNQRVEALPQEKKELFMKEAVTQLAHDFEVRLDKLETATKDELYQKIIDIDKKIDVYADEGKSITELGELRKELLKVVDYKQYQMAKADADIKGMVDAELETMRDQVEKADKAGVQKSEYIDWEKHVWVVDKKNMINPYPEFYEEIGFKNKKEFIDTLENPYDKRFKNKKVFKEKYLKLREAAQDRLENGYGTNEFNGSRPDEQFLELKNRRREIEATPDSNPMDEDPFEFGANDDAEAKINEIKENAKDFDDVENNIEAYETMTNEEINQVKELYKDTEDEFIKSIIKDAEIELKNIDIEAEEGKNIMKALASCALRGLK